MGTFYFQGPCIEQKDASFVSCYIIAPVPARRRLLFDVITTFLHYVLRASLSPGAHHYVQTSGAKQETSLVVSMSGYVNKNSTSFKIEPS